MIWPPPDVQPESRRKALWMVGWRVAAEILGTILFFVLMTRIVPLIPDLWHYATR